MRSPRNSMYGHGQEDFWLSTSLVCCMCTHTWSAYYLFLKGGGDCCTIQQGIGSGHDTISLASQAWCVQAQTKVGIVYSSGEWDWNHWSSPGWFGLSASVVICLDLTNNSCALNPWSESVILSFHFGELDSDCPEQILKGCKVATDSRRCDLIQKIIHKISSQFNAASGMDIWEWLIPALCVYNSKRSVPQLVTWNGFYQAF